MTDFNDAKNVHATVKDFLNTNIESMVIFNAFIFISSSFFIFVKKELLNFMGLTDFRDKYLFYFSIAFIISGSILLLSIISIIYKKYQNRKLAKNMKKALLNLNDARKEIILEIYLNDAEPNYFRKINPDIQYLNNIYMIRALTNQTMVEIYPGIDPIKHIVFPYGLEPWVENLLDNDEDVRNMFNL